MAKSKKLELSEKFIAIGEKSRASGMSCPLYIKKAIKKQNLEMRKDWDSWLRYPGDSEISVMFLNEY